MELKKQDLLRIISEQHAEVDEMASNVEHGYASKGRSQYDILKDANGNTVGFKMMDYSGGEPVKIPVVMVCGGVDVVQRILQENPELISQLKEEFTDIPVMWSAHKKDINSYCLPPRSANHKLNPLPGEEGSVQPRVANTAKPIENPRSISTKIERIFNEAVETQVGQLNPSAIERLQECSIPVIYGRDIKHIDRRNFFSNEQISYKTHNFNIYENSEEFLDAARSRALGDGSDAKFSEKHMRYRYNTQYDKWSETKRMNLNRIGSKQDYQGKTAVYDVDYLDFTEGQSDASVLSELTIKGRMSPDGVYTWMVTFEIKFGDTLDDSIRNRYGATLNPSKTLETTTRVEVGMNERFDENKTVLDSRVIYQGLVEALTDLYDKFFSEVDPVDALEMPNMTQDRILGNQQGNLNEALVDKIVNRIMKRK